MIFRRQPFAMAPEVKDLDAKTTFRLAHSRLGRQMRRLQKQGVEFYGSPRDTTLNWSAICTNASEHNSPAMGPTTCFWIPALRLHGCRRRMEGNACEIYTLEKDASLVAGLVTFRDGDTRRFYTIYFNPAWARYSPGQALLFEATARSLAEGLRCDYMTGEYPYKLRLANASRQLFRVDLSAEQLADIAQPRTGHDRSLTAHKVFRNSLARSSSGKKFLFRLELRAMHATAAATQLHRMLQVKHLVIHDVFHCVTGHARVVEDAADNNCIVSGIVMAKTIAGVQSGSRS